MKNFITVNDFEVNSFYRFPKVLMEGKYSKMRLESKMAYAIFLDRASLSIKNGWCNERGEIFVKIRRKTLMSLLSIKGTQKMTMIMDELSNYGLIEEKQCGFGRCNEIYLYNLEEDNFTSEDYSKVNKVEFRKKSRGIKGEKKTFENQISKLLKSKIKSFDFKKGNKINNKKTKGKETKQKEKSFENHCHSLKGFENQNNIYGSENSENQSSYSGETIELAREVLGWSVNEREAEILLSEARGNIYVLDLAHEALMIGSNKITNFIGYMRTIIKRIMKNFR